MEEKYDSFIIMYDIVQTGMHGDVEIALKNYGEVQKKHMPYHSIKLLTSKQYTAKELYSELSHDKAFRASGVYHLLVAPCEESYYAGEVNIDHSEEYRAYKASYDTDDMIDYMKDN